MWLHDFIFIFKRLIKEWILDRSWILWSMRASTLVIQFFFFPFCTFKTYFFYFSNSFLQNTHISLSILHIYSIKYSFFYIFYYFLTRGLSLSLSLSNPTTIKGGAILYSGGWNEPPEFPKKKIIIYIYNIFFVSLIL